MESTYDPALIDVAIHRRWNASLDAASEFADATQAAMRADAPWRDRNGDSKTGKNARDSLEAEAATQDDGILIIARSTRQTNRPWRQWDGAPVGAFLEEGTRKMLARPIIFRTLEALAPRLKAQLQPIWGGE